MNIITETANAVSEKKYKCPYCESRITRKEMCHHIENRHEDIIPQGMSPMQVAFNTVNKKQENYGYCIMCHSHTKWNEDKARYDRLCGSKKCHDDYVKLCADRLKKAKGITKQEMLSDPAFQDKMLKNRSISGTYKFTDGGSIGYVGSYEKNFLEFMDKVLKIKSEDIEGPGPTIKYMYKGKEHFWITDYIYKPYNLVFDIKDGGSNPNNRDMKEYREKQDAKEKAIAKLGLYNYCRLTDNDFSQLLTIMLELKESLLEVDENNMKSFKPIIRINEDAIYSAINKYPVYIVLMHSGTSMSNVIKAVTGDEFSHACISFDPALETMYSFGSKCLGSTDLGLTSIGKSNDFFKKFKAHYATYVMYLNKDQYDRMKERLQFFINKEPELKYDFPSLIACALQIPTEFRKKYFCSRFVMDVIGAGIHIDKAPSLWTPQDITLLNNITKVNGGDDFRKYDPKVTKRNMNQIKKNRYDKIKLTKSVLNESSQDDTSLLYTKILETVLSEWGTGFNALPAVTQKPIYIVNRMQNNVFSGIGYGDDYSLSKITAFQDDDNLDNESISKKIKEGEINVFKYIGSPESIVENMFISICNNTFTHDNYIKVYPEVCSEIDAVKEVSEYTMRADIARLDETSIQALSESFSLPIPGYENANFECKRDINGIYIQNKLNSMRCRSRESFDQIPTEIKKLIHKGYI